MGSSALRLVRDVMGRAPTGFGHALCALDLSLGPTREVGVVGETDDERTAALASCLWSDRYLPNLVLAVGTQTDAAAERSALLHDRGAVDGVPTAYVCEGFVVQPSGDLTPGSAGAARRLAMPA